MLRATALVSVACVTSLATGGCAAEDDLRPVWVAFAEPATAPTGARITLHGQGFGVLAPTLDEEDALFVYEGGNAVTVGGISAGVANRTDQRLEVLVPDLEPGPYYVVVWTQGTASNAFPIRVLPDS